MKALVLWIALIVAVATAVSLSVVRVKPVSTALQQFVRPGPLSPGHAYLGDRCASCHESTVGVTVAKCTACHANAERLLGRQPTAFHASIQECVACHVEHQSTAIRPIAMDHLELAKVGARTLARASRSDAASAATLNSLETGCAFVSQRNSTPAPRARLSTARDVTPPKTGTWDCSAQIAHSATPRPSGQSPEFQHPSPRSTNCAQCHQAPPSHYMMHFDMVSKKIAGQEDAQVAACCGSAQVNQCYRCHQTTSWNDIRGVGYYKHH